AAPTPHTTTLSLHDALPIYNLEQLIDSSEEERYDDEEELRGKVEEIFARGLVQAEALNYIRGRSIVKTYLIIDEAQNTTPDQIRSEEHTSELQSRFELVCRL